MTLLSLELIPRGQDGWGSGKLAFGSDTTVLLGDNGAGKTPIVKSIAYVLGHAVNLPPDVKQRCESVRLCARLDDVEWTIERRIEDKLHVGIQGDGEAFIIDNERVYSEWMLPRLGIVLRMLASKNGGGSPPYMSVVAPAFFVDQDHGWSRLYAPPDTHQFIKDQSEEIIRWFLDVPPKNRIIEKKQFEEAKVKLATVQEQVAIKRRLLNELQRELGDDRGNGVAERLTARLEIVDGELAVSYDSLQQFAQKETTLDQRISEATAGRELVAHHLASAKMRRSQLSETKLEIGAELEALEENEVAADAFREYCGSDCRFFKKPEETYGRRVLYLRDQLKDFDSTAGEIEGEIDRLERSLVEADAVVSRAVSLKRDSAKKSGLAAALSSTDALNAERADLRTRLDTLKRVEKYRAQLGALLEREARANDEVNDLRPTSAGRRDTSRLMDARHALGEAMRDWLRILKTPNLALNMQFNDDFRLMIGNEEFGGRSAHSGSTRTRIVLAYHAALVQASLAMHGSHPPAADS